MKALLAALLLLPGLLRAGEFSAETREFASRNKAFSLAVSYSGTGGAGRVRAVLTGSSGKKISAFEADNAPFSVTVSGDGRRLFFFCGSWGQSVSIYAVRVYTAAGQLLATHQVKMDGPAGEDFSDDNSLYALGTDQGGSDSLLLIETAGGKLLWSKRLKERLTGLKLSGSGNRVLALLSRPGGGSRAVIYDRSGKELGSAEVKTENALSPRVFGRDGGEFELWESATVYNEKDGYFHARLVKKRYFRVTTAGVEAAGTKDFNEEYK